MQMSQREFFKPVTLLALGLTAAWVLVGCKALGLSGAVPQPSALPTATRAAAATATIPPSPRGTNTPLPAKAAPTPTRVRPTPPPLAKMSFSERNALYFRLLAARQAEGRDTTTTEEEYARAIELMFAGDFAAADKKLNQAITDLLP